MIIIALYGLLALSIEGILADAARLGGAQNLKRFRRSDSLESKVDVVRFLGDPLSHHLFIDLSDQDGPFIIDDGSMILRGVQYDEHCLPLFAKRLVGSLYPRFQDCQTYLRQISLNLFAEERCQRNALFDPTTSSCIVFNNLRLLPGNCLMKCPYGDEKPRLEAVVKHVTNIYCEVQNDDGTTMLTKECPHLFAKQSSPKSSEMLPILFPGEASAKSNSDDYINNFPGEQREKRQESPSKSGTTKIHANKRNLKSNLLNKSIPTMKPTSNAVTEKPVEKPDELQDFIYGSEMSGDGVNYSIGEEYSDFSGAVYDLSRD